MKEKEEIISMLKDLSNETHMNRAEFCKKHNIKLDAYHPYLLGWVDGVLDSILDEEA